MLGITCALYDEAAGLLKLLHRQKTGSIYHYSGFLKGLPVSLFLTKPGLHKNKSNFIKWLDVMQITTLLQTGYCGALTNRYRPGDVCRISRVSGADKMQRAHEFPASEIHHLLTVDHPILTIDEREDIIYEHNADLIDMEAWHIYELLKIKFPAIRTEVIKIVGDVPGEELLMRNEIHMRSFFKERRMKNRAKIAFKTGWPFFELYFRKRMLQKTLKTVILDYIPDIPQSNGKFIDVSTR